MTFFLFTLVGQDFGEVRQVIFLAWTRDGSSGGTGLKPPTALTPWRPSRAPQRIFLMVVLRKMKEGDWWVREMMDNI